jgi:hypothetical protein
LVKIWELFGACWEDTSHNLGNFRLATLEVKGKARIDGLVAQETGSPLHLHQRGRRRAVVRQEGHLRRLHGPRAKDAKIGPVAAFGALADPMPRRASNSVKVTPLRRDLSSTRLASSSSFLILMFSLLGCQIGMVSGQIGMVTCQIGTLYLFKPCRFGTLLTYQCSHRGKLLSHILGICFQRAKRSENGPFWNAVVGPANGSLEPAVLALAYLSAHPKQKAQSTHAKQKPRT